MSSQHGKVVLLYFGYTNCADECPLTMAHIKLALESLGSRGASTSTEQESNRQDKSKTAHRISASLSIAGQIARKAANGLAPLEVYLHRVR
jgi:hypothetical protein